MVGFNEKQAKKQLFAEDRGVLALFYMKKPRLLGRTYHHAVRLSHGDRSAENSTLCMILPDFKHKKADTKKLDADVDKGARRWADILREKHGLTGQEVTKVGSALLIHPSRFTPTSSSGARCAARSSSRSSLPPTTS